MKNWLVALVFLAGTTGSIAQIETPRNAITTSRVLQPLGWEGFCEHYDCDFKPTIPVRIKYAEFREIIETVNRRVNESIVPMTDREQWQVADQWDFPDSGAGDCEDYAILKQQMLIEAGIPRQALLLTVVLDYQGEGHAVLTVVTDQGDYILDNMSPNVTLWRETGYRFVKRQSQRQQRHWVGIRHTPMLTAQR